MTTTGAAEQATSVPGELRYLARGSTVLRRFTVPGASSNTGSYEPHTVPIRDGRPIQDTFRIDVHGFEIVGRPSAVSDFTDKARVDAVYIPEVIEFVRERTRDDEGLPNQLYFVDRLPEDPFAALDESKIITSGSEFHYSPEHQWWYFPDMTRDELLFFVFRDSDHSRPWRVLHSAFRDPTVETAVPRHSIEVRTFAFFH